jgi:hypothetical protein
MKNTRLIIATAVVLASFWPVLSYAQADVDPQFNPANIISDSEVLNTNCLSQSQIQNFLNQQGGYLANYATYNAHGTPDKLASEIIYDAAVNNYDCDGIELSASPTEDEKALKCRHVTTVNPKFLLVLLQKEQSLIDDATPTQSQLDWATGYGCPDGWACNPYYKGLGKQINSAALQFRYYMDHPNEYKYKKGGTYTFTNPYGVTVNTPMTVTIENNATAALYNYTPHVFNGNYNFYKLWKKYFGETPTNYYPDGALLRLKGAAGVYLISDSQKRPFTSHGALLSRFDEKKIISVDQTILDGYATGTPIRFPNYSLIKTPDKKVYLLVDDKSRFIVSTAVFKQIGFSTDEVLAATYEDLASYKPGTDLTATSTYAYGALIQSTKNGGVYYVSENTKAPIIDRIMLTTKFKNRKIIKKTETELEKYQKIAPVLFDDGELLKSSNSPAVYLIADGQKRAFTSGTIFENLGYDWGNVITVSPQLLYLYPEGEPITIK